VAWSAGGRLGTERRSTCAVGEQKNIKWEAAIPGEGHASPIVWRDRGFVLAAVRTETRIDQLAPPEAEPPGGYKTERPVNVYRFVVMCLDRNTGELRWQQVACEDVPHEGRHPTNTFASASPTTDGRQLYVSFGSRGIFCYDLDGRLLWQRDLGDMVTRYGWGEATSPVISDDSLIVNWDPLRHSGGNLVHVNNFPGPSSRQRDARSRIVRMDPG